MDTWPDRHLHLQCVLLALLRMSHSRHSLVIPMEDPFSILFPSLALEHTPRMFLAAIPSCTKIQLVVPQDTQARITYHYHSDPPQPPQSGTPLQHCNVFCDNCFISRSALLALHLYNHIPAIDQVRRQFITPFQSPSPISYCYGHL